MVVWRSGREEEQPVTVIRSGNEREREVVVMTMAINEGIFVDGLKN